MKREICVLLCLGLLTGCGKADIAETAAVNENSVDVAVNETDADTAVNEDSTDAGASEMTPQELFDAFCDGKITAEVNKAGYEKSEMDASYFQFPGIPEDEMDANLYVNIVDPVDLDNDGEVEYILENAVYGCTCFDCKDGKVICFAQGEGTTARCSYTEYDGACWIVHSDTTHAGRCTYELTKYDGNLNIVDSFTFGWEDWDDDGNKRYYKGDKDITKEEYEALEEEVF